MEEINHNHAEQLNGTNLVLINQYSAADSIGELADNTTLPILQDTTDQSVASQYGAEKWYVYLIGPDQKLKLLHYSLDLDSERERLLEEIENIKAKPTPPRPNQTREAKP